MLVDGSLHDVADRVLPGHFVDVALFYREMPAELRQSRVEPSEILLWPLALKEDGRCCVVDFLGFGGIDDADRALRSDSRHVELGYHQLVDNFAGVVGMHNSAVWSARHKVAFQTIASVEKLADVVADIVTQHKSATWMMLDIRPDVDHDLVDNHELLAAAHSLVELSDRHSSLDLREGICLVEHLLVDDLEREQHGRKQSQVGAGHSIDHAPHAAIVPLAADSESHGDLAEENDDVAEESMDLDEKQHLIRLPCLLLVSAQLGENATSYDNDANEDSRICDGGVKVVEHDVPRAHVEDDDVAEQREQKHAEASDAVDCLPDLEEVLQVAVRDDLNQAEHSPSTPHHQAVRVEPGRGVSHVHAREAQLTPALRRPIGVKLQGPTELSLVDAGEQVRRV